MNEDSEDPAPETIKRDTERMVFYIMPDSKNHGEGDLEPMEKPAFDADGPIDRTNVPESLILDLLYSHGLRHKA